MYTMEILLLPLHPWKVMPCPTYHQWDLSLQLTNDTNKSVLYTTDIWGWKSSQPTESQILKSISPPYKKD